MPRYVWILLAVVLVLAALYLLGVRLNVHA